MTRVQDRPVPVRSMRDLEILARPRAAVRRTPQRLTQFQLGTSATPGNVLTADASGKGSWQPSQGSGTVAKPNPADYPKVCTIYSKTDENTGSGQQAIAKFPFYVTDFGWWPDTGSGGNVPSGWSWGEYIKSIQPSIAKNIIYWHSCLLEYSPYSPIPGFQTEPGSNYWRSTETGFFPSGGVRYRECLEWLACYVGSTLTAGITTSTTTIPVADMSKFTVGEYVLIGGINGQTAELGKVTARAGSSGAGNLTVTRGLNAQNTVYSGGSIISVGGGYPAAIHNSGDAIRPVAYAFGDPNYMLLNVTSRCPLADGGFGPQTYNAWQASFLQRKLQEPHFTNLDGIFLDNFLDTATAIWSSLSRGDGLNTNTNVPYTDADWLAGEQDAAQRIRNIFGSAAIIVGNTGGKAAAYNGTLNGGMIEGLDTDGTNSLAAATDGSAFQYYHNWQTAYGGSSYFIMNGTSRDTPASAIQTNYQVMRFQLGWTLLGSGYFTYDEKGVGGLNDGGHQTEWWYDEYDNVGAGLGYLGQPLEAYQTYATGVYTRKFAKGIVVVNTTNATVSTIPLGGTYKRINGTQDHTANDGATGLTTQTLAAHDARILLL